MKVESLGNCETNLPNCYLRTSFKGFNSQSFFIIDQLDIVCLWLIADLLSFSIQKVI